MPENDKSVIVRFQNAANKSRNERQKTMLLIEVARSYSGPIAVGLCMESARLVAKSRLLKVQTTKECRTA